MAHRTALITAGSIAAVVFVSAIAVGANLGILTVADSSPVGKLSAAAAVPTSASKVVHVYTGGASSQKYIIKKAGTVEVAATKGGLRLVDVTAKPHWKWTLAQTADKKLTVTFRSHSIIYEFMAALGRHGAIVARVNQPITKVVPAGASASSASWSAAAQPAPTSALSSASPASSNASPASARGGESDHSGGGQDD